MHYKAIILDFDGTIFRLFCNYDLKRIVAALVSLLQPYDIGFSMENDAFDAFNMVFFSDIEPTTKAMLLKKIDEMITEAELEALASGVHINGFSKFRDWIMQNDLLLAIVTNNSAVCIQTFLQRNFSGFSCPVVGREGQRPDLMKPNPHMLHRISSILNVSKEDMCFVGDTTRDYECALAFGCSFIAMAPTPVKKTRLSTAIKNYPIVDDFLTLCEALTSSTKSDTILSGL